MRCLPAPRGIRMGCDLCRDICVYFEFVAPQTPPLSWGRELQKKECMFYVPSLLPLSPGKRNTSALTPESPPLATELPPPASAPLSEGPRHSVTPSNRHLVPSLRRPPRPGRWIGGVRAPGRRAQGHAWPWANSWARLSTSTLTAGRWVLTDRGIGSLPQLISMGKF